MKKIYIDLINENQKELDLLQKDHHKFVLLRLIYMAIILIFLYFCIIDLKTIYFILMILTILLFCYCVFKHQKTKARILHLTYKKEIIHQYIDRIDGNWINFKETGQELLKKDDFQSKDLDLLGSNSLFQYICVAKTSLGKKRLLKDIHNLNPQIDEIKVRQEIIQELSTDLNFSIEFQTLLKKATQNFHVDIDQAINQFEQQLDYPISHFKILKILRLFSILIYTLCITGRFHEASGSIMMLVFFINNALMFIVGQRYKSLIQSIHLFSHQFEIYSKLFLLISQMNFNHSFLNKMKTNFKQSGLNCMKELARIDIQLKFRYNLIGNLLLNGFLMYDIHCLERLNKWKKSHQNSLITWFEDIALLESFLSLASISQVQENYCYPVVEEKLGILSFKDLKHPLIKSDQAIGNDYILTHRTNIITGSNMSGKTTFLRTIGINALLAYAGAPVLAKSFNISCMCVLTSMRIEDELNSSTSTFYAELTRIKMMVEKANEDIPLLCLIDEIFKGTNSADRIVGAKAAITRLNLKRITTFVSTHDFELCDLQNDANLSIENYHFKESYHNQQIIFDYKLNHGRCLTTNARYLLEMVGIL